MAARDLSSAAASEAGGGARGRGSGRARFCAKAVQHASAPERSLGSDVAAAACASVRDCTLTSHVRAVPEKCLTPGRRVPSCLRSPGVRHLRRRLCPWSAMSPELRRVALTPSLRSRDSLSFARSKIVISACSSSTRAIATLYGWPRSRRRSSMIERASSDGGRG